MMTLMEATTDVREVDLQCGLLDPDSPGDSGDIQPCCCCSWCGVLKICGDRDSGGILLEGDCYDDDCDDYYYDYDDVSLDDYDCEIWDYVSGLDDFLDATELWSSRLACDPLFRVPLSEFRTFDQLGCDGSRSCEVGDRVLLRRSDQEEEVVEGVDYPGCYAVGFESSAFRIYSLLIFCIDLEPIRFGFVGTGLENYTEV
ncbi:MAG: hypothetical protein EZS28_043667 [Streblomastix strix]|uniref:Uncharacterized protein n=1 Tax=Streblomastix strix TaxID=222440 RepID=A0A5J4TRD7_9EUKA|nr:MAG: hypothetical protein EZS28_043667 [Streblomastix strix]